MLSLAPVLFSCIMCHLCLKLRFCLVNDNNHMKDRGACRGFAKCPLTSLALWSTYVAHKADRAAHAFNCLLAETSYVVSLCVKIWKIIPGNGIEPATSLHVLTIRHVNDSGEERPLCYSTHWLYRATREVVKEWKIRYPFVVRVLFPVLLIPYQPVYPHIVSQERSSAEKVND